MKKYSNRQVHSDQQESTVSACTFVPVPQRLVLSSLKSHTFMGNHGMLRRQGQEPIQAKLAIGSPNDEYEQEADRVAEQVMRMPMVLAENLSEQESVGQPLRTKPLAESIARLSQQRRPEEGNVNLPYQAKGANERPPEAAPDVESQIASLRGNGQALPKPAKAFFESRFGTDFGDVRIHADARAGQLSRALNARAFTTRQDIFFGHGEYDVANAKGRKLLAHELTHVTQQRGVDKLSMAYKAEGGDLVTHKALRLMARQQAADIQCEEVVKSEAKQKQDDTIAGPVGKVFRVVDNSALIREGPPNFKATREKIPRGTDVVILRYNKDKTRAEVQEHVASDATQPAKVFGWTASSNLFEKHDISGYKKTGTLSEVSWGETSGLYPANKVEYDPEMWDLGLTNQLLAMRCAINAIGDRGEKVHRAQPKANDPIEQKLKTYHLVENFPVLDTEIGDEAVKWFFLSKNAALAHHPSLGQASVRVKSYGPFFNTGGGDVPRGAGVYVHFFKKKEA